VSAENAAIVRRFIQEYVNEKRDAALDTMVADDYVCHVTGNLAGDAVGHDAWRRRAAVLRAAFPDLQITIDDLIAADDKVVLRYHGQATHRGAIFGVEATNLPMTYTGIMIVRLTDGKIAEEWTEASIVGAVQRLAARAGA